MCPSSADQPATQTWPLCMLVTSVTKIVRSALTAAASYPGDTTAGIASVSRP